MWSHASGVEDRVEILLSEGRKVLRTELEECRI
jgi:hypothetical protein